MEKFLEGGGKIQKLESLPLPKIPTVGSRDWDWETTVGLGFAGADGSDRLTATEHWNFTSTLGAGSWATSGALNTGRTGMGNAGTTHGGILAFGGSPGGTPGHAETEEYNGSSWTEVADLNATHKYTTGAGTTTEAAICIGVFPSGAAVEVWNGTGWTEVADLNTGRVEICGGGTRLSALAFGGDGSPQNTLTEEWTIGQNIKVITD